MSDEDVFMYWRRHLRPKAKFTTDRKAKIRARRQEGFTDGEMLLAIDGAKIRPTIVNGKVYDELTLILRDGAHVEEYMSRVPAEARLGPGESIQEGYQDALKMTVGPEKYEIWLADLRVFGEDEDGILVLTAPAPIAAWVNNRFASVLQRVFGQPVEVLPR